MCTAGTWCRHYTCIPVKFVFFFNLMSSMISSRQLKPIFNPYIITVLWPLLQLFPFLHRLGYNYSMPDFGQVQSERKFVSGNFFMISAYEAPIWVAPANSESPRPMAGQRAVGAKNIFRGLFRSTKWRVGSDGCAIFLFVKKTRHSIRCPFSYLLRKMTTSECSSFSYTQNPPVFDLTIL